MGQTTKTIVGSVGTQKTKKFGGSEREVSCGIRSARFIDHFIEVLGLVAEASCPPRPMGPPKLRYNCVLPPMGAVRSANPPNFFNACSVTGAGKPRMPT